MYFLRFVEVFMLGSVTIVIADNSVIYHVINIIILHDILAGLHKAHMRAFVYNSCHVTVTKCAHMRITESSLKAEAQTLT